MGRVERVHALPSGLRTTTPRIDGMRARFPRFPHPPPPLRRCLWEGWEGRPRPHPPAAPGPSHSERARARFPRFPQDPTAIPAALRPTDPRHNAPRRRQAAEKTKTGRKPAGFAASPHHRRPLSYPLAFSWRVHRENWPASRPKAGETPVALLARCVDPSGDGETPYGGVGAVAPSSLPAVLCGEWRREFRSPAVRRHQDKAHPHHACAPGFRPTRRMDHGRLPCGVAG